MSLDTRDTFVMYRSFYEAVSTIPDTQTRLTVLDRICQYGLDLIDRDDAMKDLNGHGTAIMLLVIPLIDSSKKRYDINKRNGSKGGRPPKAKKQSVTETENPLVLEAENPEQKPYDNDYVYGNSNENDTYSQTSKSQKLKKKKYGQYQHVLLTDEDLEKLKEKYPSNWETWIDALDEGIELKGYTYKNHYLAIVKWANRDSGNNKGIRDSSNYENLKPEDLLF